MQFSRTKQATASSKVGKMTPLQIWVKTKQTNKQKNTTKQPKKTKQKNKAGFLIGKVKQVYLYGSIHTQGNSKCFPGTKKNVKNELKKYMLRKLCENFICITMVVYIILIGIIIITPQLLFNEAIPASARNRATHVRPPAPIVIERLLPLSAERENVSSAQSSISFTALSEERLQAAVQLAKRDLRRRRMVSLTKSPAKPSQEDSLLETNDGMLLEVTGVD